MPPGRDGVSGHDKKWGVRPRSRSFNFDLLFFSTKSSSRGQLADQTYVIGGSYCRHYCTCIHKCYRIEGYHSSYV